jgi:hypothetical protein
VKSRRKNPILFQGIKKNDHYFEGWYYKLVSTDELTTIAIIPGISLYEDDTHAFIQIFISSKNPTDKLQTEYIRFSYDDFSFQDDPFFIKIGENSFSITEVNLNIHTSKFSLNGTLHIEQITPLKTSLYAPNIMGPFSYLPKMECSHGIVSMSHFVNGFLYFNENPIDFDQSKGYIEKDWGTSFPKEYVWMQSNHFQNLNTSFMFSYATIPFMSRSFNGLIVVLYHNQKEYRFSTYQLARIQKEILTENEAYYEIKQGKYRLEVQAKTDKGILLPAPIDGQMKHAIKEGLSGSISIKLYSRDELILSDIGNHAGIEIMKK